LGLLAPGRWSRYIFACPPNKIERKTLHVIELLPHRELGLFLFFQVCVCVCVCVCVLFCSPLLVLKYLGFWFTLVSLIININSFSKEIIPMYRQVKEHSLMHTYGTILSMLIRFWLHFFFIYSHVHALFRSFLHAPFSTTLPPLPPSVPGRSCSALITNFVEEMT
jgi:hypothetical protein